MISFEQKKRNRHKLNIIPLINVVFLLLIFFMLTTSAVQQNAAITLPQAETAEENKDKLTRLTISSNGQLEIDSVKVTMDSLGEQLERIMANREKKLMIEADRNLEYHVFGDVLDRVRELGVVDFVIATDPMELVKS